LLKYGVILKIKLPELLAQRKFVLAGCLAHKSPKPVCVYARKQILTKMNKSRKYLSIDQKKRLPRPQTAQTCGAHNLHARKQFLTVM